MRGAKHYNFVSNVYLLLKWINSKLIVRIGNDENFLKFKALINYLNLIVIPGANDIRRRSDQSSVTIPYERSFRRIGSQNQPKNDEDLAQFQFCGCGWPQHMLLPKGTAAGTIFDIFVMITNYEQDRVENITTR